MTYIIPQVKICSEHGEQSEAGANGELLGLRGCPRCLADWAEKSFSDFLESAERTFEKPITSHGGEDPKCPNCASLRHIVNCTTNTTAAIHDFVDEEGKRHFHDRNRSVVQATCTECHKDFQYSPVKYCWCGWKADLQRTVEFHEGTPGEVVAVLTPDGEATLYPDRTPTEGEEPGCEGDDPRTRDKCDGAGVLRSEYGVYISECDGCELCQAITPTEGGTDG